MKKLFLSLVAVAFSFGLQAQLVWEENFDYSTSLLASQPGDPSTSNDFDLPIGTWYQTSNTTQSNSESHEIFEEPLYYGGYISSGKGKSVLIKDNNKSDQRIDVVRFTEKLIAPEKSEDPDAEVIPVSIYYSFMLNVKDVKTYPSGSGDTPTSDWRDIFVLCDGAGKNVGQRLRGRFFIRQKDDATIEYSISRNTNFEGASGTQPDNKGEFSAAETHLIVIRQIIGSGSDDSFLEVTVDPALTETEPTDGWLEGKVPSADTFNGAFGLGIRHRWLAETAEVQIGGIRVARTWADLLDTTSGLPSVSADNAIYATGKTIVTGTSGTVKVFNLVGQEVISTQTNGQLETNLSKGIYIVSFNGNSAKITIE